MKKIFKKGQAALEFLTTYGWAILVILVMVGVLVSMGVFSPENRQDDRCGLSLPLVCEAFSMDEDGNLELGIRNSINEPITITGVTVTNRDTQTDCIYTTGNPEVTSSGRDTITPAVDTDLCVSGYESGNKAFFDLDVTYTKGGYSINQKSTGELIVTLQ